MDDAQRRQLLFGTTAHRRTTAIPNDTQPPSNSTTTTTTTTNPHPPQQHPPRSHPTPSGAPLAAASEREMLERQNDDRVDTLRGRVGEMRHLAIDIGQEVRDHNAMLDGMSSSFDKAGDSVRMTIENVRRLAASGGGFHMCVLFLFAFVFFFLVYLLIR